MGTASTLPKYSLKSVTTIASFSLVHLLVFVSIWTGVTVEAAIWCAVLYAVRMFAVTAGYHRYFAHRTYKTSRVFRFILGYLAQTSGQKGVLWWAAHHRDHHKYSDGERDVHSPRHGFWHSHIGWFMSAETEDYVESKVSDLARYPELRWLDRHWLFCIWSLGFLSYMLFGASGLFFGFMLSTVLVWHATFFINSLAHVIGRRRYDTTDDSKNSFLLAIICFGEGWHNNHHHHMHSTRQGFYWWEIDMSYYILKVLSWFRIVWDLREPTKAVLEAGRISDSDVAEAKAAG